MSMIEALRTAVAAGSGAASQWTRPFPSASRCGTSLSCVRS